MIEELEKKAEEYSKNDLGNKYLSCVVAVDKLHAYKLGQYDGFVAGAEFGYNKINEWHYNGLPHDNKPYLCKVEHPTNYDESEYEILFFDDKDMSWFRWLTLWSGKEGNEHTRINRKVIAWKEIVPPKE